MKAASLIFSLLLSLPCFGSDADAQARYIAGLPASDATLRELTHTRDWQGHARAMDETWRALDRKQLQPVRDWTQANVLRGLGADCPLFYFFSGPDMLYARLADTGAQVWMTGTDATLFEGIEDAVTRYHLDADGVQRKG